MGTDVSSPSKSPTEETKEEATNTEADTDKKKEKDDNQVKEEEEEEEEKDADAAKEAPSGDNDEKSSTQEPPETKEHARIDDPVEPPARNAPKKQPVVESPDADGGDLSLSLPVDSNSILSRLFDPDRKQKPALWSHIKLVAPGPADQPPPGHLKWRSKDAIAAYCLKCKKQFTYTKGTSKTISRHMMAYHGMISTSGEMADEDTPVKKRGSDTPRSAEPPLKKRKPDLGKAVSQSQLLLRWLVGSFRPFSIVEDPGLHDFIKSNTSERMPSMEDMLRLALEQSGKVKQELKTQLELCEGFGLGCERFEQGGESFVSVKVAFCTSDFTRMSFTLAVKPGTSCGPVVQETLAEFELPADKLTSVTLRNIDDQEDLGVEGFSKEDYIYDVLHQMDTVVANAFEKGEVGTFISKIRKHVTECYGYVQNGDNFAKVSPEYGHTIVDIHELLQKFQSSQGAVDIEATKESDKWVPTDNEQFMTQVVIVVLKPFFDATTTLSGEKFPTVGLAFPVFRRIHDVLEKTNVQEMSNDKISTGTLKCMEKFLKDLAKAFSTSFSSILGEGHPLMWTIPLDPRLITMRGLSDSEKESVTKALVDKLKKIKVEDGGSDEKESTAESAKKQESSTMGGIFWGEDEEVKGAAEGAATYAQATVDRYYNTVRSQRRIEDPLDWWKSNQSQFPELSKMAKVWFGGSATIEGISNRRGNYTGANFGLVAFLHENLNML